MRESSALLSLIGHATRLVQRLSLIPRLYRMAGTARLRQNMRGLPGVPAGGCPRTEAHACPCRRPASPAAVLATVVLATVVLATVVLATVVLVAGAACAHHGRCNDNEWVGGGRGRQR